jgi:DNA-binding CsgD family transcriptional regulator
MSSWKEELTVRQTQVLARICRGQMNKEIAQELGLSEKTVKAHVTILLKVAQCRSRVELVLKVADLGKDVIDDTQGINSTATHWVGRIHSAGWTAEEAVGLVLWLSQYEGHAGAFVTKLRDHITEGGENGRTSEDIPGTEEAEGVTSEMDVRAGREVHATA